MKSLMCEPSLDPVAFTTLPPVLAAASASVGPSEPCPQSSTKPPVHVKRLEASSAVSAAAVIGGDETESDGAEVSLVVSTSLNMK